LHALHALHALLEMVVCVWTTATTCWLHHKAFLVPSQASLKAAGVDPTSPEGTEVPLFACMQIMKEDERTGKPVLPLFIDAVEAQQATSMAQEAAPAEAGEETLEVVGLTLTGAVKLLTQGGPGAPALQFVAPQSSIGHIQEYLA